MISNGDGEGVIDSDGYGDGDGDGDGADNGDCVGDGVIDGDGGGFILSSVNREQLNGDLSSDKQRAARSIYSSLASSFNYSNSGNAMID